MGLDALAAKPRLRQPAEGPPIDPYRWCGVIVERVTRSSICGTTSACGLHAEVWHDMVRLTTGYGTIRPRAIARQWKSSMADREVLTSLG